MNKKGFIILFLILILGSFLRLYKIGEVPPSPDWDEAAIGYNAYSLLETGKDEYGKPFPIVLQSFNDYKPALYVYFVMPLVKLFGLNLFVVRLPSAIFGVITILAVYFLIKELFPKISLSVYNFKLTLSELVALLLAISPWHIQFSRIGFEANVALGFNIMMVLFFLKGLKNHKFLILSGVIGVLSIYLYQSAKVFTPLLFFILLVIYFKKILSKEVIKFTVLTAIISLIIFSPMGYYIKTNPESLIRAKATSIFFDQYDLLKNTITRLQVDKENKDIVGSVLDNRRVFFAKKIASGYLKHYDLNWLFISGDPAIPRHHPPFMGLLYVFELPFLLIGIYSLFLGNFGKEIQRSTKILLLSWFLIVPIPASITIDIPNTVRTLNFLPLFQIFTAIGFIVVFKFLMENKKLLYLKQLTIVSIILFIVFNFIYYLNQYFSQQNYYYSEYWQYGYKEVIEEVKKIENKYDKIIVSNIPPMDQSYMFFLYYLKYSPEKYQRSIMNKNLSGSFDATHGFAKFEFRPINWDNEKSSSKILYIGIPKEFPSGINPLKTIDYLNGDSAIKIVEKR